jgi:hypothetical protein
MALIPRTRGERMGKWRLIFQEPLRRNWLIRVHWMATSRCSSSRMNPVRQPSVRLGSTYRGEGQFEEASGGQEAMATLSYKRTNDARVNDMTQLRARAHQIVVEMVAEVEHAAALPASNAVELLREGQQTDSSKR